MKPPSNLQKYLFSIDTSLPQSFNYATAYIKLNFTNDQTKVLSETVTKTNQCLTKRIRNLRLGEYDHLGAKIDMFGGTSLQLNIPYDELIHVDSSNGDISDKIYQTFYKNRLVHPSDLNCSGWWPDKFRFIGSKIQTNEFHVSLLPLIQFTNEDHNAINMLKLLFERIMKNKSVKGNINLKISDILHVYAKQDYSKFFLGQRVLKENPHNQQLYDIFEDLNDIRMKMHFKGHVFGEMFSDNIIDWKTADLHTTLGVCVKNGSKVDSAGELETHYLNAFLLDQSIGSSLEVSGRIVLVINGNKLVY